MKKKSIKPNTKPLYFVLPEDAHTDFKTLAARLGVTMKELLLQWIQEEK